MRTWREKLQAMAVAISFAEEGEWEAASTFLNEPDRDEANTAVVQAPRTEQKPRKRAYLV